MKREDFIAAVVDEEAVSDHPLLAEIDQLPCRAGEVHLVLDRQHQAALVGQQAELARAVAAVRRAVAGQLARDIDDLGLEARGLLARQAPGAGRSRARCREPGHQASQKNRKRDYDAEFHSHGHGCHFPNG